jgi:hypothetical protein
VAQAALTIKLPDSTVEDLVRDLCTATGGKADTIVGEVRALPTTAPGDLAATITAIGKGAEAYCQKGVAKAPNLLHEVFDAVTAAPVGSTTSSTVASPPTSSATTVPTFDQPTTAPTRIDTVTATAPCSPVGTTGVTSTGYPMTCSAQSCAGNAYDQPRWRATNC